MQHRGATYGRAPAGFVGVDENFTFLKKKLPYSELLKISLKFYPVPIPKCRFLLNLPYLPCLSFWAEHHSKFPAWATAAQIVFAVSPNSASCERVFSLLALFFGKQRDASLADRIECWHVQIESNVML